MKSFQHIPPRTCKYAVKEYKIDEVEHILREDFRTQYLCNYSVQELFRGVKIQTENDMEKYVGNIEEKKKCSLKILSLKHLSQQKVKIKFNFNVASTDRSIAVQCTIN